MEQEVLGKGNFVINQGNFLTVNFPTGVPFTGIGRISGSLKPGSPSRCGECHDPQRPIRLFLQHTVISGGMMFIVRCFYRLR